MKATRAERLTALWTSEGPVSTPWGVLSWRQVRELALPGALIGLLGGMIAGGLAAVSDLSLAVVLVVGVGLAVPLAFAGGVYEILLAKGKAPLGVLGPVALLWFVAFPPIRVAHAALTDLVAGQPVAVPYGWAAFVVYQVLVSVPFAIGFWWLHENFAPRWWFHIRERNPVADHFIRVQLQYAGAAEEEKAQRRERAKARRAKRR
ncbi:MAG TPA: hypothetical protein VI122_02675 [Thermoleophilaceae bacterium]|jgi:hypothetical protein